jgi:hypothetical protein
MKRNSIAMSSLVVLSSLLLTAAGAYAQSASRANVPFAFQVGAEQVPAGTYSVKKDLVTNVVSIRNLQTSKTVLVLATGQPPSRTTEKLIFRHVGSRYILTEIWGTTGSPGMAILTPKRNSEPQVASRPSNNGNTVEIALK